MATVKTTYTYAWDAGAISIATLSANGGYTFQVGQSTGVTCGFNNNNTSNHYLDINHGFYIQDRKYRVIEQGAFKTALVTFSGSDVFKISRSGGIVSYYVNDVLIYTSLTPSVEVVFLDCSLYAYGDEILNAAIIVPDDNNTVDIELEPLTAAGVDDTDEGIVSIALSPIYAHGMEDAIADATIDIELRAITATATEQEVNTVSIELKPIDAFAADSDINLARVELSPITAYANADAIVPDMAVAYVDLRPIQAWGWESFAQPEVNIELPPLTAFGADTDVNIASVGLQPIEVTAYASIDAYFLMGLPTFTMTVEWEIEPAAAVDWDTSAIRYRCTLTGAADGLPDIVLPISSFQTRSRKNPRPSYLSVIVPNATLHLPYVIARPNGEIVIEQGRMYPDGIEYDDLVRANYENFAYNEGARNSSITLTGHRTLPITLPQIVDLRGVSIQAQQQTGIRRVTAAVDFRARPGDTVKWAGQQMTAGMIAIAVGQRTATMTITEDEI